MAMNTVLAKTLCLGLVIAIVLANAAGVVCFGEDGHVSVEIAFHDHCGGHSHEPQTDHQHEESAPHSGFSSECNPCTDIPVANDGFSDFGVKNTLQSDYSNYIVLQSGNNSSNAVSFKAAASTPFFSPLRNIILLT